MTTEVWVGIFDHKHGRDVSFYRTFAEAEAGRQEIAEKFWHEVSDDPDAPLTDFPTSPADRFAKCGQSSL